MTDHELEYRLREMAAKERTITAEIIHLILTAESRGLPLQRGYPSTLEWLVTEFKYSESAAFRRIQAARLMKDVPEVKSKLEAGDVNLTNLAKTQSILKRYEKIKKERLSPQAKARLVERVENQTGKEADQILSQLFPDAAEALKADKLRMIDGERARLSVTLNADTMAKLQEIRNSLGGAYVNINLSDLISHLIAGAHSSMTKNLGQTQNSSTPSSTAVVKRRAKSVPIADRRKVRDRADHRCEFVDTSSGRRCDSTRFLEIDHIIPKAFGGGNEINNLRLLCRAHNQWYADKLLGLDYMNLFRNRPPTSDLPSN